MTENPFYRLAPFIQEYIWANKWTELRSIQVEACEAIFDTSNHVLLASGTASGKTEAAFLPVLTELLEKPSSSIGILYIGPLKALINDQFFRLEGLLKEADYPVWAWHGDISASKKKQAIKQAKGVLQITPESLEGFLMNRAGELQRLFGDLRFVIIDEIHAFMASDRGRQILCQLSRLEQLTKQTPRRIGLSATLGDYAEAEDWLAGETEIAVTTINDYSNKRNLKLALMHYEIEELSDNVENVSEQKGINAFHDHVYDHTLDQKSLIFVNRRGTAEEIILNLKARAKQNSTDDIYFAHHGSISASYREDAEKAMRHPERPACTAATLTLELGIDLGHLKRVLQIESSASVSSFVQRLGRTGRRGEPGEMLFYTFEKDLGDDAQLPDRLPWDLLQSIAIIQLYIEEKWIEPIEAPQLPFSLLYHQTMSMLVQYGELSPPELAQRVLTLPPFKDIGKSYFKTFLKYLLEIDHLEWTETKKLLIGLTGEKIVGNWRFLAVFEDNAGYKVVFGTQEIGTLPSPPGIGIIFALAGRAWKVTDLDEKRKIIFVEITKGKSKTLWSGGGASLHDRIAERMKQVLEEDGLYPYLQAEAVIRLEEARAFSKKKELTKFLIHEKSEEQCWVLPWKGSQTVMSALEIMKIQFDKDLTTGGAPYYFAIKRSKQNVRESLADIPTKTQVENAVPVSVPFSTGKFDPFLPEGFVREAFLKDGLRLDRGLELIKRVDF